MSASVSNIAKGRYAEFAYRINANDPANSAFVLVVLESTMTHATFRDYTTLDAVIRDANTDEVANTNYSRRTLTDASSITVRPDNSGDTQAVDFPDVAYTAVGAGDTWTYLVVGFDSDTTGGDDTSIIPCGLYDILVSGSPLVPNGGDVTLRINSTGAFVAS